MGRPPDLDLDVETLRRPTQVWVEGKALVYPADSASVLARDRLIRDASAIGLHAHVQPVDGDGSSVPRRRRFSFTRVTAEAVRNALNYMPGSTLPELAEELFKTHPWTEQAKAAARHRCEMALGRLKRSNEAEEVYHPDGKRVWGPPGWRVGSSFAPPLPEGVTKEMALAGARLLSMDADLAARVFAAMTAAKT